MAEGEPPEGWRNRLSRFLRHFAPAKLKETKIRGGAKKGNKREDGEGSSDKSGSSPPERTLHSSSPPLVPAHSSAAELVIAANETRKGARKRHRRRRTKKAQVEPSPALHPDGVMIEPPTVFVADDAPTPVAPADHERTLDAPAPVVVADTDTQVWQDPPKKGHGGPRTDPAAQAQGMALEPTIVEHSALNPTIAKQERDPKASAFYIVPTPNDDPMVGAVFPVASNEWKKAKKPRARWAPIPPPPRLAPPTPPRRASPPERSSRHRVAAHQGDETEEEESDDDDEFGIKKMFELKGQEVAQEEEANEREEEEVLHLNYWIKNKELRGKTLCLICYLEGKIKVPEIPNKEDKAIRHLREAHRIKREHVCKRTGCWVTGRTKREIGMHQLLCHNIALEILDLFFSQFWIGV